MVTFFVPLGTPSFALVTATDGRPFKDWKGLLNHQGKDNVILFPVAEDRIGEQKGIIKRRERLGGLLNFYYREAG